MTLLSLSHCKFVSRSALVAIVFVGNHWKCLADDTLGIPVPANEAQGRLLEDIRYLASDALEGRAAETVGLKMGAEYIANRFQQLGLRTDLFDGKPFQDFTLAGQPGIGEPSKNSLTVTGTPSAPTALELGKQFQPQFIGKNGEFSGKLVFGGYGITANLDDLKYDDYQGMDLHGKVVIVLRKEPQQTDPKSIFDGTSPSEFALFSAKERNATAHGAAGLILVNDALSDQAAPDTLLPVAGSGTVSAKDQIPTVFVQRSVVESWLQAAGHSLKEIEAGIDQDLQPRSFEFPEWTVQGSVDLAVQRIPSMNVVGLLPGNLELKDEYVVVGAHFDHVGMGGAGSLAPGTVAVHNGADDNASGTICMMETARRMVELAKSWPADQPRRSLVFMGFSGEERGLLGSEHYVNHPRFELENTVAMLNLDMVGRLSNDELTIYGTGTAQEFDGLISQVNESLAFNIIRRPEGMGPSDHQSFFQKNVPVLHFFTGFHDDYHRPSDDFDKINLSGIDRITDMVTKLADRIATTKEKPSFVKVTGRANPRAQSVPRRIRLGVRLDMDGQGVVVERVMAGGVAKKAGIVPGDKLLKINDDEIGSRKDLDETLLKFKSGDVVSVWILRGEEKIELKVDLAD